MVKDKRFDRIKAIKKANRADTGPHGKAGVHADKRQRRQRRLNTKDLLEEFEEDQEITQEIEMGIIKKEPEDHQYIFAIEEALEMIESAYGTLDYANVSNIASNKRSQSAHSEHGTNLDRCGVCGILEAGTANPIFHPEVYLDEDIEKYVVKCSICNHFVLAKSAHLHQGIWIGHYCCWDERLHGTE